MLCFRWRTSLLAAALTLCFSTAHATKYLYLYDPSVVGEVDINTYTTNGTVLKAGGGGPYNHNITVGPAPAAYPTIDISTRSFEFLGTSSAQIDGVVFVNHANYYVPNRLALVLWTIRIPVAAQRAPSEFDKDLTLSLWVDWNQDNLWKPSERMLTKSLNVANQFPTTQDEIVIEYLASFRVPDITSQEFLNMQAKFGSSGKEVRYLWVRTLVAYDDADVSPDGDQLFGEYEDYRIGYSVKDPATSAQ